MTRRIGGVAAALTAIAVAAPAVGASPAAAGTPAPAWTIGSFAVPTRFSSADTAQCLLNLSSSTLPCDRYVVTATEAGSLASDGTEVKLTDELPSGVTVQHVGLFWSGAEGGLTEDLARRFGLCMTAPVQCVIPQSFFETHGDVQPDQLIEMVVYVTVNEGTPEGPLTNVASISGGGAAEATTSQQNVVSDTPVLFGAAGLTSDLAGVEGAPYIQAGGHPYELTTTIDLANEFSNEYDAQDFTTSVEDLKDVVVDLPVGFLGSAIATPTCALAQLSSKEGCPPDTAVGHILTEPQGNESVNGPIFNLVPERGVPAELGFKDSLHGSHVMYTSVIPSSTGYVLQVSTHEIPQVQLTDVIVTFYGDPASRDATGDTQVALLTNPADCSGQPLSTTIHVNSWQHPAGFTPEGMPDLSNPNWVSASTATPAVTGCEQLQFHPTIAATPTTSQTQSPSGLDATLDIPQDTSPGTLATPPLKNAVVTLPQGVSVNPSSAAGLSGCTLAEIGMSPSGEPTAARPKCPESSKIGTVEVSTPLLANPLLGAVYLAAQNDNPFGSLVALYIVIDDPSTGTVVKLPGDVQLDPVTGRITTVFANLPQLPFSQLRLRLKEGPRAPLATPLRCGSYSTAAELTPWSAPESGPPASLTSPFEITTGCSTGGFAPTFTAGTSNNHAGSFSPFSTILQRNDGEQSLSTVTVAMPPGLAGMISKVTLCPEAQANAGDCPPESQIGHVTVQAGVGSDPITLPQEGRRQDPVYLTGPYEGAPFGLSIVVHAEAGPFDLGDVVVRAKIDVDPHTAGVSIESKPMPQILQGVPVDVRTIEVTADRPSFIFNPTDCKPTSVTGSVGSDGGSTEHVSSRFQAADCAALSFKPTFKAETLAHHTRRKGSYLKVTITSTQGQANLSKVDVTLPKKLAADLATLKQACREQQFAANAAACPKASFVGTVVVHTPVLSNPLTGPAIFVSHGGAKFPGLALVLQAEGITIIQEGATNISKGFTSSSFNAIPDLPVSSIEVTLPESDKPALGGNGGNLCYRTAVIKTKAHGKTEDRKRRVKRRLALVMPTTITGQNGAVIEQKTKVSVRGC